jgi:O-antigen/teichoic acid export membrane protein
MGAFVVICFGYVAGSMSIVLRLQKYFVRYALIALVFNVGLNLIFVPKYGFVAAAWVTLGTELMVEVLALGKVLRTIEMRPELTKFIRVGAAVLAMGLIVWALRSAGAGLLWLAIAAALSYPALLIVLRAFSVKEITLLLKREAPQ